MRHECQDKNTRKAKQNAKEWNRGSTRINGTENKDVSESSYEPTHAPTSLQPCDDCAATNLKPLGNS